MPEHQRIAEQVLNAAKKASEKLKEKYSNSKVAEFLSCHSASFWGEIFARPC